MKRLASCWPSRSRRRPWPRAGRVQFTDVTAAAGIKFMHNSGERAASGCLRRWDPERRCSTRTATAGWTVLLVNGRDWKPRTGDR